MVLQENLAGIRVVKSFVRMDKEIKRFSDANEDLYKHQVKVTTLFSILFPSMLLIINLSILGVVWLGGQQVIAGTFTVGEIVAFTNYLLQSIFPLLFLAILGATGSGKTTLVNLIPRFYDATKGRVTIDGIDVRELTIQSLREKIAISLQEPILFSGTVKE